MTPETKTTDPGQVVRRDDDRGPATDRFAFPRARQAVKMGRAYVVTTIKAPRILLGPKRYVLLLSHARGFTSLLSHILGSHPEICGACDSSGRTTIAATS